jgi:hypothetical protein
MAAELRATRLDDIEAAHGLTRVQASVVVRQVSTKLRVRLHLQWKAREVGIWRVGGERSVNVPGGLVRAKKLTADGLTLILAHEAAHLKGAPNEAEADYWAARHGLRLIWGDEALADGLSSRAVRAAYSALRALAAPHQQFRVRPPGRSIELLPTGYPTMQSRWDIYMLGFLGRELPRPRRAKPWRPGDDYPNLVSPERAAKLLGVSMRALLAMSTRPHGPVPLYLNGEIRFDPAQLSRVARQRRRR